MEVTQPIDHDTHLVIGGLGKSLAAEMSDSADFFLHLSNTLYQHKKLAVVRETLANAWDAHIIAGREDVAIDVTLTDTEMVFTDHGPGIPHDQMQRRYLVFGGTTKAKDATQTGGFGVGCKSPWAYVDHFTVVSRHGGSQVVYAASRGDLEAEGRPYLKPVAKTPCADTGLTVRIPLKKPEDKSEFLALIERIASNGGMKVLVNGESVVEVRDFAEDQARGWIGYHGNTGYNEDEKLFVDTPLSVRYGTIVYPVDSSQTSTIHRHMRRLDAMMARNFKLVLMAEPGTLTPALSRETLSMTPNTVARIEAMLTKAVEDLEANVIALVTQVGDKGFRRISYRQFRNLRSRLNMGQSETWTALIKIALGARLVYPPMDASVRIRYADLIGPIPPKAWPHPELDLTNVVNTDSTSMEVRLAWKAVLHVLSGNGGSDVGLTARSVYESMWRSWKEIRRYGRHPEHISRGHFTVGEIMRQLIRVANGLDAARFHRTMRDISLPNRIYFTNRNGIIYERPKTPGANLGQLGDTRIIRNAFLVARSVVQLRKEMRRYGRDDEFWRQINGRNGAIPVTLWPDITEEDAERLKATCRMHGIVVKVLGKPLSRVARKLETPAFFGFEDIFRPENKKDTDRSSDDMDYAHDWDSLSVYPLGKPRTTDPTFMLPARVYTDHLVITDLPPMNLKALFTLYPGLVIIDGARGRKEMTKLDAPLPNVLDVLKAELKALDLTTVPRLSEILAGVDTWRLSNTMGDENGRNALRVLLYLAAHEDKLAHLIFPDAPRLIVKLTERQELFRSVLTQDRTARRRGYGTPKEWNDLLLAMDERSSSARKQIETYVKRATRTEKLKELVARFPDADLLDINRVREGSDRLVNLLKSMERSARRRAATTTPTTTIATPEEIQS